MDQALKQRLIGAIILIALAVIFVPMLLDEPVSENATPALEIPPRPQVPVHTRRIPAQPGEAGDSLTAQTDNSGVADSNTRDDDLGLAARRPTRDHDVSAKDLYSPEAYLGGSHGDGQTASSGSDDEGSASDKRSNSGAGSDSGTTYSNDSSRFDPTGLGSVTPPPTRRDPPGRRDPAAPSETDTSAKREADNTARRETASTDSASPRPPAADDANLITNSPPVAANPAASLITPNDGNGSGLIPDNQWALQVASFSTTENASRLARQLRELGYNPNLDTIYRGGAALHRVRVGPFSNRQAAAAAGERIASDIQGLRPSPVAPRVGDTPERTDDNSTPVAKTKNTATAASGANPDTSRANTQSAPAPAKPAKSDDGLDRYAVQLGVFSAPDNADRLQTRVREAGYSAFVERVDGANGTRFLVKVGPLLSRNDASATRDRIERELGMKGILVDYF